MMKIIAEDIAMHKGSIMGLETVQKYLNQREEMLNACIAHAVDKKDTVEAFRLRERLDVIQGVKMKIEDYMSGLGRGLRRLGDGAALTYMPSEAVATGEAKK